MTSNLYLNPPCVPFGGFSRKFDETPFTLIGVPLEATVSYRPGTRFAPLRIREVSRELETYSLRAGLDFEKIGVYDAGDLTLFQTDLIKNLNLIGNTFKEYVGKGKRVIILGGEHTLTLACIRELSKEPTLLIDFDAHMDLRDEYPLGSKVSHATVMRRVSELSNVSLIEIGVRGFSEEEYEYAKKEGVTVFYLRSGAINANKFLRRVKEELSKVERVYLSIDMDVLDPSIAPGVGNPEPGGLTLHSLLNLIASIVSDKIVAFDVVEVCPPYDISDITSFTAARVVYEVASLIWRVLKKGRVSN
ncbi:MAG: agmatinase [Thermofilum sp. ex4484_15]|nr:MAG: agmatinase [Thermofilum sp. ex4484_15]